MNRLPPGAAILPTPVDDFALPDERAAALVRHWYACRGTAPVPTRHEFNAFTLRPWLGWLSIYQRLGESDDFRVTLDGTDVVAVTGDDWTGRRVSDIDREFGTTCRTELLSVLESGLPRVDRVPLLQKSWRRVTRLWLPVAREPSLPPDQIFLGLFID
jgi:hypothetical protein